HRPGDAHLRGRHDRPQPDHALRVLRHAPRAAGRLDARLRHRHGVPVPPRRDAGMTRNTDGAPAAMASTTFWAMTAVPSSGSQQHDGSYDADDAYAGDAP